MEQDIIHVIPTGDYRDHISSKNCWCNPCQDEEEPMIYIHNSLDGREKYEDGIKSS